MRVVEVCCFGVAKVGILACIQNLRNPDECNKSLIEPYTISVRTLYSPVRTYIEGRAPQKPDARNPSWADWELRHSITGN